MSGRQQRVMVQPIVRPDCLRHKLASSIELLFSPLILPLVEPCFLVALPERYLQILAAGELNRKAV